MARFRLTRWKVPVAVIVTASIFVVAPSGSDRQWTQFGGPRRDFTTDVRGLAASWPVSGPRPLWKRELGEGFSPIAVGGEWLFTMYQRGEFEVVVAMDAATGITIWQQLYFSAITPEMSRAPGPRATPLVIGNAVYTVGATGKVHRLHRETGQVSWTLDLRDAFNAPAQEEHYASSPLAYRNTIILPVGGPGAAVVALDQKDGRVLWKAHDYRISYASPILVDVDGQRQVVLLMETEVIAVDPENGTLLWTHPHANGTKTNVSTPLWLDGNLLFVSSAYDGVGRMLKLTRRGRTTVVEEVWQSRDLRIHIGNAVRVGDTLYGSSGDFGPAFFSALDVRTGKVRWQLRDVPKVSIVLADGKFLMLTEQGELWLASPGDEGLIVHSRAQVLAAPSWTPPSLAGTKLYLRDRRYAMALEMK